ncbi:MULTISPECIES: Rieske 2Fe-2S domain-containing protein [unclassified Sphingomonas]|uniref:Rieske 2Fe-2S domain-containing protein n=1 Tax=unclassified Sphingomonas TaxID=196159 RepID=UPI000A44B70D
MFLQNAWYPVAWCDEISADAILARKILGRELALYRDVEGQARAMVNRCPHRFAPLSLGKRIGDAIQCPYHGLHFGPDGRRVHNPHGDGAVPDIGVQAFPVREQHKLIWAWMGSRRSRPTSSRQRICLSRRCRSVGAGAWLYAARLRLPAGDRQSDGPGPCHRPAR